MVNHTCVASTRKNNGRTASAKSIGNLIMHRYECVKEGPKSNDVVHIMRTENGRKIYFSSYNVSMNNNIAIPKERDV